MLELPGISKRSAAYGAARRRFRAAPRRDPRPRRRERRRQDDADEDHRRRAHEYHGKHDARRARGAVPLGPRCPRRRHRHGPPGTQRRSRPDGGRERLSRQAADARRHRRLARHERRRPRASRQPRHRRRPTHPHGSLAIGLQQLVEIARVLFSGARIVILDEPTSALSPPEVQRLFEVLRACARAGAASSSSRISSTTCWPSPTR